MVPSTRHRKPQRINVIGTSGSGKTMLAAQISQRLGIPHIELDALHWDPNWNPAPREVFRERVIQALGGETWAVDGNYGAVRDITWSRADTIVWLDYSLPVIMGRVTQRTIRRLVKREELWNGNRERFGTSFLSRESIIWWALSTYHRRRKEYPILLSQPQHAHLNIVHLGSPHAARGWLKALVPGHRAPGPQNGDQR
jgi:adenylate kinase family enzyme